MNLACLKAVGQLYLKINIRTQQQQILDNFSKRDTLMKNGYKI